MTTDTKDVGKPNPKCAHLSFVKCLVDQGGPQEVDYEKTTEWFNELAFDVYAKRISQRELAEIRHAFGGAFGMGTMQGMAFLKPHGYSGDFEIIDRVFDNHRCEDLHLRAWDDYWQSRSIAHAIRNRISIFHELMDEESRRLERPRVLSLASGPGRDLATYFSNRSNFGGTVVCLDSDREALDYARSAIEGDRRVSFVCENTRRFTFEKHRVFDLIWSAGLFDSFDDDVFIRVLSKLLHSTSPKGRVVVGNFGTNNPSRGYMLAFDWLCFHRSENKLITLGEQAADAHRGQWDLCVRRDATGTSLFLEMTNRA